MSVAELVLIYALNNAVWKMTDDGVPQICMSVPVDKPDGSTENFQGCTAVPDKILRKWLEDTHIKV